MSDFDPQTLEMVAYVAAGLGLVQVIYGATQSRSTDPTKQFVAIVIQNTGIGFLVAAGICYFAKTYDWTFPAAMVALFVFSSIGSIAGMKALKARGAGK